MAIPKFAPLVIVDGIVREISTREFTDRDKGTTEYRGRKVILMTGRGFIEIAFGAEDDHVQVVDDQRLTVFCTLSEWKMTNGNAGATLTFADHVTRDHLTEISKSLPEPVKVN